MHDVKELRRHAAPAGRPQPLAMHDGSLWVGCRDTRQLFALDPATLTVRDTVALPGEPFGLVSFDGALHVVVSIGEDDDRYRFRFVPGTSFDRAEKIACPELTGSSLATDGKDLFLVQATFGKLVRLSADGGAASEIALPTRCAGLAHHDGGFAMIAADDDFDRLEFGTLALEGEAATFTPLADISADARGLAHDGTAWWTNLRDASEMIAFSAN